MVPKGWTTASVGELLAHHTPGFWGELAGEEGRVAVLRSTNLRGNGLLDLEDIAWRSFPPRKLEEKQLLSGDILLERSGGGPKQPVGRVAYFNANGTYSFSNFMQCLRPNASVCDAKFLVYELWKFHQSGGTEALQQATTGIRNLQYRDYLARVIPLPSVPEQRKIAAILSTVDDAIEGTQAVIDQLQVVKKAMMAELLTRGLPGQHTRFRQTEIGEIPTSWRAAHVGELLLESAYGTSVKCDVVPGGLPVLRIPNVVSEKITTDDLKYASSGAENDACRLRSGDLLVIRTNGNPDYVGRTAVFPELDGVWLYASYLIRLRPKMELVTPSFLHEAMRSEGPRRTMRGAIRTSAGNYNLNTQGIANTIVPLPPLAEQVEITAVARTIEARLEAERGYLDGLLGAKAALMSVLLTGELRVTPDEATP